MLIYIFMLLLCNIDYIYHFVSAFFPFYHQPFAWFITTAVVSSSESHMRGDMIVLIDNCMMSLILEDRLVYIVCYFCLAALRLALPAALVYYFKFMNNKLGMMALMMEWSNLSVRR